MSKNCSMCGVRKRIGEFTLDKRASDGHGAHCRQCAAEIYRRIRLSKRDADRNNRKRPPKNPGRERAKDAVRRAIARGDLVRPDSCGKCGVTAKIQAHHDDYRRKTSVRWLCQKCHSHHHMVIRRPAWYGRVVRKGSKP